MPATRKRNIFLVNEQICPNPNRIVGELSQAVKSNFWSRICRIRTETIHFVTRQSPGRTNMKNWISLKSVLLHTIPVPLLFTPVLLRQYWSMLEAIREQYTRLALTKRRAAKSLNASQVDQSIPRRISLSLWSLERWCTCSPLFDSLVTVGKRRKSILDRLKTDFFVTKEMWLSLKITFIHYSLLISTETIILTFQPRFFS